MQHKISCGGFLIVLFETFFSLFFWILTGSSEADPKLSWDPAQFHPLPQGRMEPQASQGPLGAEGDCGILSLLLPSPQSEAMTHEMEELSLQPTQSLPPLNERKNGKDLAELGSDTLGWKHTFTRLLE